MPEDFKNRYGKVFFKQTLTEPGYSTWLVPDGDRSHLTDVYVQVKVSGASAFGFVEFTSDDPALVKSEDASVEWVEWSNGSIAAGETSYLVLGRAMTGIRFHQTGSGQVICGASY